MSEVNSSSSGPRDEPSRIVSLAASGGRVPVRYGLDIIHPSDV